MDVTNQTTNAQTQTGTGAGAAGQTAKPQIGEEFNSFIKLLTAQVQHQDPLSPMDSTKFVEQLATFSNLEQQVKTNTSLDSIASMIGDLHAMLANEWIGKKVSVESSWVPYSGNAIEYGIEKPDAADKAVLTVKDGNGESVWSEELDLDAESYTWNGQTKSGVTPGNDSVFEFSIDMYQGDTYLGAVAPQVITEVTDIGNENGTMRVGTSSRLTANMDEVRQVQ